MKRTKHASLPNPASVTSSAGANATVPTKGSGIITSTRNTSTSGPLQRTGLFGTTAAAAKPVVRRPTPATPAALPASNVTSYIRRREMGGGPPSQLCTRQLKVTPQTVKMSALLRATPAAMACVHLGFSRCGRFLLSYSFDEGPAFELQAWRFRLGSPLVLACRCPLFAATAFGAHSEMGDLLDGSAVRVTLWEPADSGCLVAIGVLQEEGAEALAASNPPVAAVSIIPCPFASHPARGSAPTAVSAVHYSTTLAPFCRPSVVCLEVTAALEGSLQAYRLILNCSGGLKVLTFAVAPASSPVPVPPCLPLRSWYLPSLGHFHVTESVAPLPSSELTGNEQAAPAVIPANNPSPWASAAAAPATQAGIVKLLRRPASAAPAADPSVNALAVSLLSQYTLDPERLLARIVTGRVVNYDLRLVRVFDSAEATARSIMPAIAVAGDSSGAAAAAAATDTHPVDSGPKFEGSDGFNVGHAGNGDAAVLQLCIIVDHQLLPEQAAGAEQTEATDVTVVATVVEPKLQAVPQITAAPAPAPRKRTYGVMAASSASLVAFSERPSAAAAEADPWNDVLSDSTSSSSSSPASASDSPTGTPGSTASSSTASSSAAAEAERERSPVNCSPSGSGGSLSDSGSETAVTVALAAAAPVRRGGDGALSVVDEGRAPAPLPAPAAAKRLVAPPPVVRSQLVCTLHVGSGAVRLLTNARLAHGMQPAFDKVPSWSAASSRAGGGVSSAAAEAARSSALASLCAQAAARLRAAAPPRPAASASRELNNDALLKGESLRRLVHPTLPVAIVLG